MSTNSRQTATTVLAHDRFIRLSADDLATERAPASTGDYPVDPVMVDDSLLDTETRPQPTAHAGTEQQDLIAEAAAELEQILARRHPAGALRLPELTAEAAKNAARRVLSGLPEDEFDYRWGRMEVAHARAVLFAQPGAASLARTVLPAEEAITVEEALGRTLPADPDQSIWQEYADCLAEAWRGLCRAAIDEATQALAEAGPGTA